MTRDLTRTESPEEREIRRKQAELAILEDSVAQRELDLATLKAELASFEREYLESVAPLLAELDEACAQGLEAQAAADPDDKAKEARARRSRIRANESQQTVRDYDSSEAPRTEHSSSLKSLFREVAKLVHPDFAVDDEDRARRTVLMTLANDAYAGADEAALLAILAGERDRPEAVTGDDFGARLVRLIRTIARAEARLIAIGAAIAEVEQTEMCLLMRKAQQARDEGRDLLQQMVEDLLRQTEKARNTLAKASPQ